jgi:hypothetical protein
MVIKSNLHDYVIFITARDRSEGGESVFGIQERRPPTESGKILLIIFTV